MGPGNSINVSRKHANACAVCKLDLELGIEKLHSWPAYIGLLPDQYDVFTCCDIHLSSSALFHMLRFSWQRKRLSRCMGGDFP
jgi:hypothetical protein